MTLLKIKQTVSVRHFHVKDRFYNKNHILQNFHVKDRFYNKNPILCLFISFSVLFLGTPI